jgi:hypothetical protein
MVLIPARAAHHEPAVVAVVASLGDLLHRGTVGGGTSIVFSGGEATNA